jgi:hypothetical protein
MEIQRNRNTDREVLHKKQELLEQVSGTVEQDCPSSRQGEDLL